MGLNLGFSNLSSPSLFFGGEEQQGYGTNEGTVEISSSLFFYRPVEF